MGSLREDIGNEFLKLQQSEHFIELQGKLEQWSDNMKCSLMSVLPRHMRGEQLSQAFICVAAANLQLQRAAENHREWLQLFQNLAAHPLAAVRNAKLHQFMKGASFDSMGSGHRLILVQKWYAPCTAIVQSSGWGKARAMREIAMAQNQIVVIYFSLLDENETGYPKADLGILNYSKSITKVEHEYRVFHACFEWLSEQESFRSKEELFKDHEQNRYHRVLKRLQDLPECTEKEMGDECSNVQKQHAPALRSNGVTFLFVFDEARSLLKSKDWMEELPFLLLRRASSHLFKSSQSFVLFIDTS